MERRPRVSLLLVSLVLVFASRLPAQEYHTIEVKQDPRAQMTLALRLAAEIPLATGEEARSLAVSRAFLHFGAIPLRWPAETALVDQAYEEQVKLMLVYQRPHTVLDVLERFEAHADGRAPGVFVNLYRAEALAQLGKRTEAMDLLRRGEDHPLFGELSSFRRTEYLMGAARIATNYRELGRAASYHRKLANSGDIELALRANHYLQAARLSAETGDSGQRGRDIADARKALAAARLQSRSDRREMLDAIERDLNRLEGRQK
jgi:hypothetical protein